jgi:hypothetical protein
VNKRTISNPDDSKRIFVGLDVHKKYTEVAAVDEDEVVTEQDEIENKPRRVEEFSNSLSTAIILLESSFNRHWLYETRSGGIRLSFLTHMHTN